MSKDKGFLSSIFLFWFLFSLLIFFSFKLSNSISFNLDEKALGSRSNVSVSPIRLRSLSKKITLSKFWKINLVENKNFLISSVSNCTSSLSILSIVLLIIFIWLIDFFLLNLAEYYLNI